MTALERIFRGSVFLHSEQGRLPALNLVTGGALTAIRTLGELSIVCVFVTVGTFGERNLFLEISVGVALGALDPCVLSLEWIFRLRVIEALIHVLEGNLLPAGRGVAGRTGLREAAVMRIRVTIRAQVEGNANILRFSIRTVGMALRALHLGVQSGQGIASFAVIELPDIDLLPVDEVVAGLARGTEPPFMKVFVAGNAGRGEAKIGAVQVLILDCCTFLRRDMRGAVTLVTRQSGVLAFKYISGFVVVERLGVPLNQRKVFAVVLGVALCALLAGASGNVISGVQAALGGKTAGNLGVAFQTFEGSLPAELVATGTVCGSAQRLVGPR